MKIFVTGSAGFIGSHLVNTLKEAGHEVFEFDKLLYDSMDIVSEESVSRGVLNFEPDVIIHLAANANPGLSVERPEFDLKINTLGTVNILKAVSRLARKPFLILMSSAYVYGEVSKSRVDEFAQTNPNSPYGISKLTAEHYVRFYSKKFEYKFAILRLFNIYGPGQKSGYVVPDLLRRISELDGRNDLEMRGHPEDTRDFLYIGDLLELFRKMIESKPENEVFNVGSGYPTRIRDLTTAIARNIRSSEINLKYNASETNKPSIFYSDPGKVQRALNWRPRTPLTDGISRTVQTMIASTKASK